MAPKLKVGLKKKDEKPKSVSPPKASPTKYSPVSTRQLSKQVLLSYLQEAFQERFKVKVVPKSWVLPNRAKYPTFIDVTFKYGTRKPIADPKMACSECEGDKCTAQIDSIKLFPYQQFVVDFMQFASPYRGVLLYITLGGGKSCTAIAAAEALANNMKVIVMTPASLRNNYIEEVKKCGRQFYAVQQKWLFAAVAEDDIPDVVGVSHIGADLLRKQKGIWVPASGGRDFAQLPEEAKSQIKAQIDNIVDHRIRFINYNGLNRQKIKELTSDGARNPFDGACVVVDEIHNLIGRVVNGRLIGRAIYKLLMQAKGAKLVLLSGTPIINQPHEIAFIVNLITGPRRLYEVRVNKGERFDAKNVAGVFEVSPYVDRYIIDPSTRKIAFELLPTGFEFSKRPNVVRSTGTPKTEEAVVDEVLEALGMPKNRLSQREGTTLPDDPKEFNRLFINADAAMVTNQDIFARRVMGTVSYYKAFSEELYPSVKVENIECPLTDFQFSIYEKSRQEERRKEAKAKQRGAAPSIDNSGGQVYRFYSRANCNFVFPEAIKRPFPTSAAVMKGEVDMAEEGRDAEDVEKDIDAVAAASQDAAKEPKNKRDLTRDYQQRLTAALADLAKHSPEYLTENKLAELYSPKMAAIIKRLRTSPGTALVYSQFRTVEGLGVLGMALKQIGWAEFKLKKNLDVDAEGGVEALLNKPLYVMFTGNNDESKAILKMFNGELDTLPDNLRQLAPKLDLRVIMITQSGAEGISLKKVRQVHVMEPYWNQIRVDQVIGRAVRTCSHVALPKDQRNVTVYLYRSVFTTDQLKGSFTIRTQDKSETSDQYIYGIAQRKAAIINKLLSTLQNSAIDCAINAKYHRHVSDLKCYSFPINMRPDALTYDFDIAKDKTAANTQPNEWNGQVLITKKGQFLIRPGTQEVYDYDLYLEAGRLVKLGVLEEDGKTRRIVFDRDD